MVVRTRQIDVKLRKIHQKWADELESFVGLMKIIAAS